MHQTAERPAHRATPLLLAAFSLLLAASGSAAAQFSGPALNAPTTDRAALTPTPASDCCGTAISTSVPATSSPSTSSARWTTRPPYA